MTTNDSANISSDDALEQALAHSDEVRQQHHSEGQLDAPSAGTDAADDRPVDAQSTGNVASADSAATGATDGANWAAGRPVHFEIHAADPQRASQFYARAFGWQLEDWSEYAGMPYFGVTTGTGPGIDGAIMQRQGENPPVGGPVAGGPGGLDVDGRRLGQSPLVQRREPIRAQALLR